MSDQANWGTLTLEVPDFLESTRDAVNSVAEFLVVVLDVVLESLKLAKAFLTAFLDPILALLQVIIDEINGLIQDIQQIGIYITGDWRLFDYPFDELRGGYAAYERRMIARLTDRTDPTRPNVSGNGKIFGLFFYNSVNISDIQRLMSFIQRLVSFFKQDWNANTHPTVKVTEVRYGISAASLLNPTSIADMYEQLADSGISGGQPNIAQVRWKINTPNKTNPYSPFPVNAFGPDGFIITVSTLPDGLRLCYDRPQTNTDMQPLAYNPSVKVQPREYGYVRSADGKPIILYGGADTITLPESLSYNLNTSSSGPKLGSTRVYGFLSPADNTPIPVDELKFGNNYYYQRTFYLDKTSVVTQSFTGEYSFELNLNDMPFEVNPVVGTDGKVSLNPSTKHASNLYVRIAAVNKRAIKKFKFDLSDPLVEQMQYVPGAFIAPTPDGIDITDVGMWSEPAKVMFPNAYSAEYLQSVQTALVVLMLSRPDLVTYDQMTQKFTKDYLYKIANGQVLVKGTAKTACGLEDLSHLLRVMFSGPTEPEEFWKSSGQSPIVFKNAIWQAIQKFTQESYSKVGSSPETEKYIAENTAALRTLKWKDILAGYPLSTNLSDSFLNSTILESINPAKDSGKNTNSGVAVNPWCIGLSDTKIDSLFFAPNAFKNRVQSGLYEATTKDPFDFLQYVPEEMVNSYYKKLPLFYQEISNKYIQSDGSVDIPDDIYANLNTVQTSITRVEGSADRSPVIFTKSDGIQKLKIGQPVDDSVGMVFCRGLFMTYGNGKLIQETRTALGLVGSAWRRNGDGQWIAIRFFDMIPGIPDFLETIRNWIEAIKQTVKSIVDTIIRYIEWLEARIIEIQQLIRRINGLIQSILGFSFQIPACSALLCVSNGTDGLLADFVGARGKPNDSPLSYGAGFCMVVPFMPTFVYDILTAVFAPKDGNPSGQLGGTPPQAMIPLQGLPTTPTLGDNTAPDTL